MLETLPRGRDALSLSHSPHKQGDAGAWSGADWESFTDSSGHTLVSFPWLFLHSTHVFGKHAQGRQDAILQAGLFHWALERWGAERKSSAGLTSRSRPRRSLSKSTPALGPWGDSTIRPTHLHGGESSVRAPLAHTCFRGPQLKGISLMARDSLLPLQSSLHVSSCIHGGTAGQVGPAVSVPLCATSSPCTKWQGAGHTCSS